MQFVFRVDPRHRLSFHVVTDILLHQPHRWPLVALQPRTLHAAQKVCLLALQLGGGEAMAQDALHLFQHRVQPALDAVFVDPRRRVQHGGVGQQQPLPEPRPDERRIGHLGALEQAGVGHHREQRPGQQVPIRCQALTGPGRQLGVDAERGGTHLRVGIHRHTRFGMRRNGVLGTHRGRLGTRRALLVRVALRRRSEVSADALHHLFRIEIAHHGHRHQVGPVPALIEGAQVVRRGRLDHLGQADREPLGVARIPEQHGVLQVSDARARATPGAPFLQYHPAFLFHLLRIEGNGERPVAEHLERGLDYGGIVRWYLDLVDGFVERGVGVEIGAELGTDRFQVFDDFVPGKAFGTVESHVLDVVREAALVLLLEDRAGAQGQPELGAVERFAVFLDVVGQAVAERAAVRVGVERKVALRGLRPGQRCAGGERQDGGGQDRERTDSRRCGTGRMGMHEQKDTVRPA